MIECSKMAFVFFILHVGGVFAGDRKSYLTTGTYRSLAKFDFILNIPFFQFCEETNVMVQRKFSLCERRRKVGRDQF